MTKKHCVPIVVLACALTCSTGCGTLAGEPSLEGRVDIPAGSGPAVVFLNGVTGSVPQTDTVITHTASGAFEPAIAIGYVGNEFVLRNEDDELHTTHLYLHLAYQKELSGRPIENGATLYNIALPRKDMEVRRPIKPYHQLDAATGGIDIRCNPHPDEAAAALVFDHPYVTITDDAGAFAMENAPPGRHELWVWHGGVARKWKDVEIKERGATDVAVDLGDR